MKWERVQFLAVSDVVAIHAEIDGQGILKPNELESAVLSPQATYGGQPLLNTLADIAAAYLCYLSRSHAFNEGNKRTAFVVALTFLDVNGHPIEVDEATWVDIVEQAATGHLSRERLAELFASEMGTWGEIVVE